MITTKGVFEVSGKIFNTLEEAQQYEVKQNEIDKIRSILPKIEDPGCNFSNGGGYYQLTGDQVTRFMAGIGAYILKYHGQDMYEIFQNNPHAYYVGRSLDAGESPLYGTYGLLLQIDSDLRLWGQPYFAYNPGTGKNVRLNKE